jgi:hypothetical protein
MDDICPDRHAAQLTCPQEWCHYQMGLWSSIMWLERLFSVPFFPPPGFIGFVSCIILTDFRQFPDRETASLSHTALQTLIINWLRSLKMPLNKLIMLGCLWIAG